MRTGVPACGALVQNGFPGSPSGLWIILNLDLLVTNVAISGDAGIIQRTIARAGHRGYLYKGVAVSGVGLRSNIALDVWIL